MALDATGVRIRGFVGNAELPSLQTIDQDVPEATAPLSASTLSIMNLDPGLPHIPNWLRGELCVRPACRYHHAPDATSTLGGYELCPIQVICKPVSISPGPVKLPVNRRYRHELRGFHFIIRMLSALKKISAEKGSGALSGCRSRYKIGRTTSPCLGMAGGYSHTGPAAHRQQKSGTYVWR